MNDSYKSLPGWTYTSEAFFELEKTELILKNWQLVCHISNVPNAGDFFTFEIFNKRILLSKIKMAMLRHLIIFALTEAPNLLMKFQETVTEKLLVHIMPGGMTLKEI